jgi:hypothetical protein
MDNLSTASNEISNQIGALELGDNLESRSDGALEAVATMGPSTTVNCTYHFKGCATP